MVAVERDLHHESRWLREELGTVKLRLFDLERDNRLPSVSAGTKLLLALLLPLAVYLLTGSIEKAVTAASFVAVGG
jgi:hypothetical protein